MSKGSGFRPTGGAKGATGLPVGLHVKGHTREVPHRVDSLFPPVLVKRVIDGDTIELVSGEKVRYEAQAQKWGVWKVEKPERKEKREKIEGKKTEMGSA